jgi:ubiquinone/menaquinone biosynthesis C-methylase UbiE
MATPQKRLLHVGCGDSKAERLPAMFLDGNWREVRLDIEPAVKPDVVASITDMSMVPSSSFDAVYSSHNIEHLHPHEVAIAIREFARVLVPDGFALILCPDLQSVGVRIAEGNLHEALYESPAGPVAPIDIVFGHRGELEKGHLHMAHRTGFTQRSLAEHLIENGFTQASVQRQAEHYSLLALGFRENHPNIAQTDEQAREQIDFPFPE